jgi:protein-tyrosine phosphatase
MSKWAQRQATHRSPLQAIGDAVRAGARAAARYMPSGLRRRIRDLRELSPHERGLYLRGWMRIRRDVRRPFPADAQSVLVVCHGNIMRSALGDVLLRHAVSERMLDLRVESAGLAAVPGRSADPRARRAAELFGVSLDRHQAQPLTWALIERSDVILVMDLLNEARLLARFPAAAKFVRLLGEYDPQPGALEIPDPYLRDEAVALRCFERVARCIESLPVLNGPVVRISGSVMPSASARRA